MLVGPETSDDAGVFWLNERQALVQTVDFFAPVVDDPYTFGQTAAANSLSDVYAMGAIPITALNIACFPTCLTAQEMGEIVRGGNDKLLEAGVLLLGGHTVENPEPRFGMAVTGMVHPEHIWRNVGAKVGDALLLSKPLGTGVLATAYKADMLSVEDEVAMISAMVTLNRVAAEVLGQQAEVHACTDITGFGLLGHLLEMVKDSEVGMELYGDQIPLLSGALEAASIGLVPAGAYRNREYVGDQVNFAADVPLELQDLLFDPQTSGGLLVAVPSEQGERVLAALREAGVDASMIGRVNDHAGHLTVSATA